jgi:site-specific DNA recombinase
VNNLKPTPPVSNDQEDWFAYIRVSSDDQRDKQTIETQRREIERTKLVPANHIYADDGVSGTVKFVDRPGSRALLQAVNEKARSGRSLGLLVNYLDRLGRDGRDTADTALDMLEQGFRIRSVFEGDFENTPEGRLMVMLHSGIAESARFRILKGTGDGLRRTAENGGYTGGFVPFGYRVEYHHEGKKRTARLMPDTTPLPGLELSPIEIARRMLGMTAERRSCQKISDWLNMLGVPPSKQNLRGANRKGKPGVWRPNSVRVIIRNPIYKGTLQWGRRSWIDKHHLKRNPDKDIVTVERAELANVDGDLWQRANAALHENQIVAMAHAKNDYLLRGLISCGVPGCGCKFGGRGTRYACIGRYCAGYLYGKKHPRCPAPTVRRADLEAAVWSDIEVFLVKPGAVIRQLEQQMAAGGGKGRLVADDIAELEPRLKLLDSARAMALRQLTRRRITEPQFDKEIASIDREKTEVEGRLAELREIAASTESQASALCQARSALERLRDTAFPDGTGKASVLPFEQRRALVVALVASITVTPVSGQKQPSIRICYTFKPHAGRYVEQWDGSGNTIPLEATLRHNDWPGL